MSQWWAVDNGSKKKKVYNEILSAKAHSILDFVENFDKSQGAAIHQALIWQSKVILGTFS